MPPGKPPVLAPPAMLVLPPVDEAPPVCDAPAEPPMPPDKPPVVAVPAMLVLPPVALVAVNLFDVPPVAVAPAVEVEVAPPPTTVVVLDDEHATAKAKNGSSVDSWRSMFRDYPLLVATHISKAAAVGNCECARRLKPPTILGAIRAEGL